MPQYFKDLGEDLVRHGYRIVPLPPGSKGPRMKGWPQANLSVEDVRRMAANGSAQAGVGVIAASTPAIDVDILDDEIAQQMSDEIDRIFAGQSLMTRTGMAPKFLVPFRSDTPFRKMVSNIYTDGKNEHKVEILGDGQQWVAYHIHPDTERPYRWFDGLGDDGLRAVSRESLPSLSRGDAQLVIDAFERIASGLVAQGKWSATVSVERVRSDTPAADDPFAGHTQPVGKTEPEVARLLRAHPNGDASYEHWFQVLAALHHELADAGRELAYEWSSSSSKHTDEKFDTTWNSLGRYTGRPVTLRSLLKGTKPEPALPAGASEDDPFPFYAGDEYAQGFQNVREMVEDLLPDQGTGMVYGASQSGKTFWAMDIAFCVHNGVMWRDKEVKQGSVFYIAAEAGRGIRKRIAAYKKVHPETIAPFFADTAPDLLDSVWVDRIKDSIRLRGGASLVVIDTMSASFTGDDSSQQETAVMVQNCSNLAKSLECLVLFVHHAKKDGASWRGSGVLYNDNDVVIEISADGEGAARVHCAHVVKQRDDEAGQKFGFRLVKSGKLGEKPNGKPITSCTIEQTDVVPAKKEKKSGPTFENDERFGKQRHYLDILAGLAGLDNQKVEVGVWINAIQNDPVVNETKEPDYPRADSLTRSFHRMAKQGKISLEGLYVRLLA
jgi:KaiC/GvpD/RAD55 family RecA-like ATPase